MISFHKDAPYSATLKERYPLTLKGSTKNTQHLELQLCEKISYQPGASVGVLVQNDPHFVHEILQAIDADGEETVLDPKTQLPFSLNNFLLKRCNLARVSPSLLKLALNCSRDGEKRDYLAHLLSPEQKALCTEFLQRVHVPDFVQEFLGPIDPALFIDKLFPLLPRFYSIASSMSAVGNEVHLLVKLVEYKIQEKIRRGVASHYLVNLAPIQASLPIWIQANDKFKLPQDSKAPIIMIGPGTGVAPFRAFLQERWSLKSRGKNWLFFGECHRQTDFFYQSYLEELEGENFLKLTTAFSRDQAEKIYVQQRLLEHASEIWQWIEEGAFIYICGDAEVMAKGVQAAFLTLFQEAGKMDESQARAFLKQLRQERRYLQDIY